MPINRAHLRLTDLDIPADLPAHERALFVAAKPPEAPAADRRHHHQRVFAPKQVPKQVRAPATLELLPTPKSCRRSKTPIGGPTRTEKIGWEGVATMLTATTRAALLRVQATRDAARRDAAEINPYFGAFGAMDPEVRKPPCAMRGLSRASSLASLADDGDSPSRCRASLHSPHYWFRSPFTPTGQKHHLAMPTHMPGVTAANQMLVSALYGQNALHRRPRPTINQVHVARRNSPPDPLAVLAQAQRGAAARGPQSPLPLRWMRERRPRPNVGNLGRNHGRSRMSYVY